MKESKSYTFQVIPSSDVKFDPYYRFPLQFSTFFISDNPKGIREFALISDIEGCGFLDDENKKMLRFHMRGPDRHGQTLYGIYDEYYMQYNTQKSDYLIGDNSYKLSYLTEYSRYGRGGRIEHSFNNITLGSFILFPRFYPEIKQEVSAYLGYSPNKKLIINLGYLNKLGNSGTANHLMTFNGTGSPLKWANLEWEYALGTVSQEFKMAYKTEVNIKLKSFRFFYNYMMAQKGFPGYFSNSRFMLASGNIILSNKINLGANYSNSHQNIEVDTLYGSAPYAKNMFFAFNYSLIKGGLFSVSYNFRGRQDRMEPMKFNYNEKSIKLNLNQRIKKFNFYINGEYGHTENLLLSENERLTTLYRGNLTINYQVSDKLIINWFGIYQQSNRYLINNKNWNYGASVNGALNKKLSLSFNYQNNYDYEENYIDRSILDGRIIYSPSINNRFEILSRYHMNKNSLEIKEFTYGARYTHTFNVALSKKKEIGKLSGRVINKGVKTVAGIILSIGSSQAVTDKNGNYYFPMLPAGSYYLMLDYSKAGVFAIPETPGPYKIEILPGIENRFDIALVQCAKITGEVSILKEVSDDDKSYAGIREHLGKLLVEAKNGSEVYRNFTKEDGQFSFESLRPGQWSVKVYPAGIPKEYELVTDQFNVSLQSGQNEHIEVKVKEVRRKIKFQTFINTNPPSESQPAKNGSPAGKTGSTNAASKPKPISKSAVKPQGKPLVSDTTRIKKQRMALNDAGPAGLPGDVEYRIQLGAYEQPLASTSQLAEKLKITEPIAAAFFKGKYIYTIGSFKTQQEAVKKNREIRKVAGAIGPFVVSFRNGKRTATIEKPQQSIK